MSSLRQQFSDWWKRKKQPAVLILLYHRVAQLETDPQLLSVIPQFFNEHMEILSKNFHVVDLAEVKQLYDRGELKQGHVAITFDDGYADNFHQAKPILERHNLPATVFVTTGYVQNSREFWWDELENIFLNTNDLPDTLQIDFNGESRDWNLGQAKSYGSNHVPDRAWDVTKNETPTIRHELYRFFCEYLHPLRENEREKILSKLRIWSEVTLNPRESHRPLLPHEVVTLVKGNLVKVGAHTKSHSVLSQLQVEEQSEEINDSKTYLQDLTGKTIESFAYPFGTQSDYTKETAKLVRNAGFKVACSNFPPSSGVPIDFFEMPRVLIRNWDGEEFSKRLLEVYRDTERR